MSNDNSPRFRCENYLFRLPQKETVQGRNVICRPPRLRLFLNETQALSKSLFVILPFAGGYSLPFAPEEIQENLSFSASGSLVPFQNFDLQLYLDFTNTASFELTGTACFQAFGMVDWFVSCF